MSTKTIKDVIYLMNLFTDFDAKIERLSISPGNNKMGKIPSVSLPPIQTCAAGVPCVDDCYVIKNMPFRTVNSAYEKNYLIYLADPDRFFRMVKAYCELNEPEYFRYFVGGDIPDQRFLDGIIETANRLPETKFMFMTKFYMDKYYIEWKKEGGVGSHKNREIEILNRVIPDNLSVVISTWPKYPIPHDLQEVFPIAYMDDGTEERLPKDVFECKKSCDECSVCWNLKKMNRDVVFHKH